MTIDGRSPTPTDDFGGAEWFASQCAIFVAAFVAIAGLDAVALLIQDGSIAGWGSTPAAIAEFILTTAMYSILIGLPSILVLLIMLRAILPRVRRTSRRLVTVVLVTAGYALTLPGMSALAGAVEGQRGFLIQLAIGCVAFGLVSLFVSVPGMRTLPTRVWAIVLVTGLGLLQLLSPVILATVLFAAGWAAYRRELRLAGLLLIAGAGPWTVLLVADLARPDVPLANFAYAALNLIILLAGLALLSVRVLSRPYRHQISND